jgi:subtilase family serine protease
MEMAATVYPALSTPRLNSSTLNYIFLRLSNAFQSNSTVTIPRPKLSGTTPSGEIISSDDTTTTTSSNSNSSDARRNKSVAAANSNTGSYFRSWIQQHFLFGNDNTKDGRRGTKKMTAAKKMRSTSVPNLGPKAMNKLESGGYGGRTEQVECENFDPRLTNLLQR